MTKKRVIPMKIKPILTIYFISAFLFICPLLIYSQDIKPIKLLAPQLEGGKSLMQALTNVPFF
jgi:hypothetical protein